MQDKAIWEHLSKELAKANTVLDLSQRLLNSLLFKRVRYNIFTVTILDSYTRVIFLSIYNLFDKKYSWCLYSLPELTISEKNEVVVLMAEFKKYIDVRHEEIGHSSKKVKFEKHKRLQWLPDTELDKIKELFKRVSRFLNAYGMRKFDEGYGFHYSGPDSSLQCLIEDLERIQLEHDTK